jgi:purine nucleosidase
MTTKSFRAALAFAATVFVLALAADRAGGQSIERAPVLIDTDIGTEIDDTFALGLAIGSYELDVRGITTVGDSTQHKGMMACRFLTVTGRRHIRVAVGQDPQPKRPLVEMYKYYYHPDPLFDRTTKPEKQTTTEFLLGRIKQQPGKVTLVALGPLTNVARLLDDAASPAAAAAQPPPLGRIVLLESNIGLDVEAARKVFASGIPLVVLSAAACRDLRLDDAQVAEVFRPGTPLTRQIETMYQMWDRPNPPLGEALAVALCFDERFATFENRGLLVDGAGRLGERKAAPHARLVTAVKSNEFARWYAERMGSLVAPGDRPSEFISPGGFPNRVHVAEDYDNDIELFWWMSGKPETALLPVGSKRACRGVLTHDFDDLLMVSREMYSAVIFNPVPGPPMGKNTRLSFRYWVKGTDTLRVQIYSLTNGYHRHLVVKGLPQETWQHAAVDMTQARRPDGTGGPLGENERIDDIQFYADPNSQIIIDDVLLYDAPAEGETRPFPKRVVFTAVFDTGNHPQHWRGDFEIVPDAGNFWRAIRSVSRADSGEPWIRLQLKGERRLGETTHLAFRYRLAGADKLRARLVNSSSGESLAADVAGLKNGAWTQAVVEFATDKLALIDEIQLLLPKNAEILVDDVLLFEPG